MSDPSRKVTAMTTTTSPVLLCFARGTIKVTAEHHPGDKHGAMKYSLHVTGGRQHGMVIHCSTEVSVARLFNEVVALCKLGICHPYLSPLSH